MSQEPIAEHKPITTHKPVTMQQLVNSHQPVFIHQPVTTQQPITTQQSGGVHHNYVCSLDLSGPDLELWRRIGLERGLSSDAKVAIFLLSFYEMHKTIGASDSVCRMCKTPLPTTCAACRMSPQLQDNRNSMQEGSQCTADPVGDTLRAPGDLRQLKSLEANVEGEGEVQVKCEPEESVRWGAADAVDRDDAVETGRHPESTPGPCASSDNGPAQPGSVVAPALAEQQPASQGVVLLKAPTDQPRQMGVNQACASTLSLDGRNSASDASTVPVRPPAPLYTLQQNVGPQSGAASFVAGGGQGPAQCLLLIRLPVPPAGVNTTGIRQPGVNTTGILQRGVNTTGILQSGVNTTGILQSGVNTTGILQSGVNTTSILQPGVNTTSILQPQPGVKRTILPQPSVTSTDISQPGAKRTTIPTEGPSSVVSEASLAGLITVPGETPKKQTAIRESTDQVHDGGDKVKQYFKCDMCTSEFVSEQFLHKHRLSHDAVRQRLIETAAQAGESGAHAVPSTWTAKLACQVPGCYKRLSSPARLKTHVTIHTRGTDFPFLCRWCGLPCRDSDTLDQHLRDKHRLFPCPLCKQQFRAELTFKSHMRSQHGSTKPFQCQWCRKAFSQRSSLRGHVHKRHSSGSANAGSKGVADGRGARAVVEGRTPKVDVRGGNLPKGLYGGSANRGGKGVVEEFEPHVAGGGGDWRPHSGGGAVTRGANEVAGKTARPEDSGGGERKRSKFQCDACGSTFHALEGIKFHILKSPCRHVPLLCGICGRLCKSREELLSHDTSHHSWVCFVCSDRFCHSRAYARHVREQHPGHKPYRCEQCHVTFNHHGWLKTHRRKHTGERPVLCPECGKTFIDTQTLRRHRLAVHRGARPFSCPLCPKAFRYQGALSLHRRQHEIAKPFLCDECGRSFTSNHSLRVHKCAQVQLAAAEASDPRQAGAEGEVNAAKRRRKERTKSGPGDSAKNAATGLYSCPQCAQTFTNKRSRRSHVASHERCVCPVCKRKFLTKKNRDRHICCKRDTARKCNRIGCNEVFHREEDLARHAQTHVREEQQDDVQTRSIEDRQEWFQIHSHSSESLQDDLPPTEVGEDRKDQIEIILGEDRKDQVETVLGEDPQGGASADFSEDRKDPVPVLVDEGQQGQATIYVGEDRKEQIAVVYEGRQGDGQDGHEDRRAGAGETEQRWRGGQTASTEKTQPGDLAEAADVEKRFECEECDRYYRRRSDLNIHRRLHRGERSFKCSICHEAYHSSSNLSSHMRSKHRYRRGTLRKQSFR